MWAENGDEWLDYLGCGKLRRSCGKQFGAVSRGFETIARPPSFPRPSPVIPADAGASADGTSIQNQQSTPFHPIPASTPVIPVPKPRHSRGRGNPESTKHAYSRHPGGNHRHSAPKPRHSRGRGNPESTKHAFSRHPRNHWRSAARVLQRSRSRGRKIPILSILSIDARPLPMR